MGNSIFETECAVAKTYIWQLFKVVPAMHTSQIHFKKSKNLYKNLKVGEMITFGEQSFKLFFMCLDV